MISRERFIELINESIVEAVATGKTKVSAAWIAHNYNPPATITDDVMDHYAKLGFRIDIRSKDSLNSPIFFLKWGDSKE